MKLMHVALSGESSSIRDRIALPRARWALGPTMQPIVATERDDTYQSGTSIALINSGRYRSILVIVCAS